MQFTVEVDVDQFVIELEEQVQAFGEKLKEGWKEIFISQLAQDIIDYVSEDPADYIDSNLRNDVYNEDGMDLFEPEGDEV